MSGTRPLSVGVDLGSTALKAAILDERGRLRDIESTPAPPLVGEGQIREGDAESYARAAERLLRSVAGRVSRGTPLGLAVQRSSFTLWSRHDGSPRFPLVSWQDRRAAEWCDAHRALETDLVRRTGLLLSAHYVGPKLAAMQDVDPVFRDALHDGRHALGTLDTFLKWRWSDGRRHESDVTVAARTAMLDLSRDDWSPELLTCFGVPSGVLPRVVRTLHEALDLDVGLKWTASLSDQAAAVLAVLDPTRPCALVNLGTGAFVLSPAEGPGVRRAGYLLAPILAGARGGGRFVLEGTINGAGPAVDSCGPGPTVFTEHDPAPEGFAIPDMSGLGAPYWRPEIGFTLSSRARGLRNLDRRRIVVEGLLFRVRQILEDLHDGALPERVVLAGGLTRDPGVGSGLAALFGRPVELLREHESGLLGASRLAAGLDPHGGSSTRLVSPQPAGAYLPDKYRSWRDWLEKTLSR